jgi:hypothetical protein
MWTTDLRLNEIEFTSLYMILAAGDVSPTVEISYLGSKYGSPPVAPYVAGTWAIPVNSTIIRTIDLTNAAFTGGYGAVRVRSIDPGTGQPTTIPFIAMAQLSAPDAENPVSGSGFFGTLFRLPVIQAAPGQRVKLAVTNVGAAQTAVRIRNPLPGSFDDTYYLDPGVTLRWDSNDDPMLRDMKVACVVEVSASQNLVVSALVSRTRGPTYHIHLAKVS